MCIALQVSEYDCLLLEHVFGNRPDDAQKVKAWLLETIASDPGLQQVELVFLGLFGRACRILESQNNQVSQSASLLHRPCLCICSGYLQHDLATEDYSLVSENLPSLPTVPLVVLQEIAEAQGEVAELVDLLKGRASELALTLDADYPDLRSSIWLSEAAAQSAVQSLMPQMTENRKRVCHLHALNVCVGFNMTRMRL